MFSSYLTVHVLELTKDINCGSSITSLVPALLFLWNLNGLADSFLKSLYKRDENVNGINRFGQCCFKKIIGVILLWSGIQCWSHGLIRFLKTYTAFFLVTINGSLKTNHQMSQTTIDILESMFKWIVCYTVATFVRICDISLQKNYYTTTRIRRFRRLRLNNHYWYRIVPTLRQMNELGDNDVIILESHSFPGIQLTENSKPMKLLETQSCHLLTNRAPILTKQIKERPRSI